MMPQAAEEDAQTVLFWGGAGPDFDEHGLPFERTGPIVGLDKLESGYRETLRGDYGDTLDPEAERLAQAAEYLGYVSADN